MSQYRKKPCVIDAFQVTEEVIKGWLMDSIPYPETLVCGQASYNTGNRTVSLFKGYVRTLESDMNFGIGDWIITGVKGEKYPCKPDIFEATYEKVEP